MGGAVTWASSSGPSLKHLKGRSWEERGWGGLSGVIWEFPQKWNLLPSAMAHPAPFRWTCISPRSQGLVCNHQTGFVLEAERRFSSPRKLHIQGVFLHLYFQSEVFESIWQISSLSTCCEIMNRWATQRLRGSRMIKNKGKISLLLEITKTQFSFLCYCF